MLGQTCRSGGRWSCVVEYTWRVTYNMVQCVLQGAHLQLNMYIQTSVARVCNAWSQSGILSLHIIIYFCNYCCSINPQLLCSPLKFTSDTAINHMITVYWMAESHSLHCLNCEKSVCSPHWNHVFPMRPLRCVYIQWEDGDTGTVTACLSNSTS